MLSVMLGLLVLGLLVLILFVLLMPLQREVGPHDYDPLGRGGPGSCFLHMPRALTAVWQPVIEQKPLAPCFTHSFFLLAVVPQPDTEQLSRLPWVLFAPCFWHRPRALAGVQQPDVLHIM